MISAGKRGKCPHCMVVNKFEYPEPRCNNGEIAKYLTGIRLDNGFPLKNYDRFSGPCIENCFLVISRCSNCGKNVIYLDEKMIYPLGSSRPPCPNEVPTNISQDYTEACLVEPFSKKASAALSRRCLQNMLHDKGIVKRDLSQEIDEAMKTLPSNLAESIDAIRHIGNFAAHPIKSTSTGEITDVEDEEAEWALDVLEGLFDYYYVQPSNVKRRTEAMNKKLTDLGKPPLKTKTN